MCLSNNGRSMERWRAWDDVQGTRVICLQGPVLAFPRQQASAAPRISASSHRHHQLLLPPSSHLGAQLADIVSSISSCQKTNTHPKASLSILPNVREGAAHRVCPCKGAARPNATPLQTSSHGKAVRHRGDSHTHSLWPSARSVHEQNSCVS